MIGLKVKLFYEGEIIEETELKDRRPGTYISKKIISETESSYRVNLTASPFEEKYIQLLKEYVLKSENDKKFTFSINSFEYNLKTV